MSANQRRKQLTKQYGRLYKRVEFFDFSKCAYCGAPRELLDHVPAITLLDNINVRSYRKKGGKLLLYPCCSECNKYLGASKAVSYHERLTVLETRYARKLNKIEVWDEDELKEMGHVLRAFIQANQCKLGHFNEKLSAIHERLNKLYTGELTEDGLEINLSNNET